MRRMTGVVATIYRDMGGFLGGAFISFFILGLLTHFWSLINGIDSVAIRVGATFVMGAILSLLSSHWGATSAIVAVGAGFIVGAFVGGAAGLVVVGVASGVILGGLVGAEIHRPYESTFKK